MKAKKPYSVQGDAKGGFRVAVPTETGVKKGDRYDCTFVPNRESGIFLPAGSLIYVPAPDPTSKHEKKDVGG
jgi:hypothetical protein